MYYDMTGDKKITISLQKYISENENKIKKVVEAESWTYANWQPVCFRTLN